MTPNAVGSVSHVAHYNHSSLYLLQIERSRTLRGGQCEAKLITGKRALLRVVCSLSGHSLPWSSSIAILDHNCESHCNVKLRWTLVFLSRVPLDDAKSTPRNKTAVSSRFYSRLLQWRRFCNWKPSRQPPT